MRRYVFNVSLLTYQGEHVIGIFVLNRRLFRICTVAKVLVFCLGVCVSHWALDHPSAESELRKRNNFEMSINMLNGFVVLLALKPSF